MENIKRYLIQNELLNKQNINQMTFLNTIYDDVNRTSNKIEKGIKLEILQSLIKDYQNYKINSLIDNNCDKAEKKI